MTKQLDILRGDNKNEIISKVKEVEEYANSIHKQVVSDYQNWSSCHQAYIKASQQFDSKLGIVLNLEKNYQQLL